MFTQMGGKEGNPEAVREQVYSRIWDYRGQLEEALLDLKEDANYFDSGDLEDRFDIDIRTQEVGMMLAGLYSLGMFTAYDSEKRWPSRYLAESIEESDLRETLHELPRYIARRYRARGLNRKETAEKLAEITSFSPATFNSKFTEWGITWGPDSHPEELREEVLEEAEGYSKRKRALGQLSEEYDLPERTVGNWLSEEGISFTHPDERRETALSELRSMKRLGFPRNYSLELVSYLEDVPEGTVNEWMKGEIQFSEEL